MTKRRIAVITPEPVAAQMAGPAIRAWHMADLLAAEHEVRLLSTASAERVSTTFAVGTIDEVSAADARRWADVVITHPGIVRTHPAVATPGQALVVDVYDPFHLENLESDGSPLDARQANVEHLTSVINDALRRGDFFLCASEPQRDFWIGALTALGRVNPATYDRDPTLRGLIDVAPFGIDATPPTPERRAMRGVIPGIGDSDLVLLWGGGVYNWFDPVTLIDAIALVRREVANVRLVFLGMRHPNPHLPPMRAAAAARHRADELGLTDRHVFFNEEWVPYDERAAYLLDADVGVSTHLLHVETAYSFRTRILDYLWAGLPVVTSEGDVFASLAATEGFGVAVAPGDAAALAAAIIDLLQDHRRRSTLAVEARRMAVRFAWPEVLRPLLRYCREGALASDHPGSLGPPDPPAALRPADAPAADLRVEPRWPRRRRPRA